MTARQHIVACAVLDNLRRVPLEMREWTDRVFGRDPEPDLDTVMELTEFCRPDHATLLRLTEVFENSRILLAPYSDESLNRAFWALSTEILSAGGYESIELGPRHRFIRSIEMLFREFFAERCRPVLGHLSEEGSPLNSICYMWWDLGCWSLAPATPVLASMRGILAIDHAACQESALHGLGHWHWRQSAAVESIIDEFLEREPHIGAQLREYAHRARTGCVL
jgi:hypothetical protein